MGTAQGAAADAVLSSLQDQSKVALEAFTNALPAHRLDLTLVESLNSALDKARKRAVREFETSDEAALGIAQKLEQLQGALTAQVCKSA